MKNLIVKIVTLSLLLAAAPMAAQAETGWTIYKPGVVMVAPITFCATATKSADDAYKLPCVMYFE